MNKGTVSGGIFNYSPTMCNMHGCSADRFRGLVCKEHWERYAISDERVQLLDNIETITFGSPDEPLRELLRRNHRAHALTGQPTAFVEHFPLESLFHMCRRHLIATRSNVDSSNLHLMSKGIRDLIFDFGWERNEWLADLRLQYAEWSGDLSTLYHADTSVSGRAGAFFPLSAEKMWLYSSVVLGLILAAKYSNRVSEVGLFVPLSMSFAALLATYSSYVGTVVFGLLTLQRLDSVGSLAAKHRLYVDSHSNKVAVLAFARIRASFDRRSDSDYVTMGFCSMTALFGTCQ